MASIKRDDNTVKKINKVAVTVTAMLAMIAMIMSSTMVNVAIPDIMGAFGIGQDQAHWISTGFLSAMTAGMLLNAWLVTNFGPRNVFIGALTFFSVVAIGGQYAPTFEGVVIARIAQGLCAGLIQPLALSTVYLAYPPEQRGPAMGWFGLGIVFGPTIGPVLGGMIVDFAQWRFVFSAPVPIMVIAALMASMFMPGRDLNKPRTPFNIFSFFSITAAIMLFLSGISAGQRDGWNTDPVFYMLFGSALALTIFLLVESGSRAPLLQIRLFQYRNYVASALIAFIFGAGMFGSLYIIPVMVQTIHGFTALKAGLMLLPGGIVSMIVFPVAGRLSTKVNPSRTIAVGLGVFGISCWLLADTGMLTSFWIMAFLVAFGRIGLGLVVPSLNLSGMNAVPNELVPFAAGTLNFVRMTGASIGVTTLAIIIDNRSVGYLASILATQTPNNFVTQDILQNLSRQLAHSGLTNLEEMVSSMTYLKMLLSLKAQELAFQDGHASLGMLFVIGMIASIFLFRRL
ncbi:MAG: MFS transporter [Rhodospirillaceae bacterium]|nr:MFS transporter [Rhodospirillaceae bacterium]